ERNFGDDELLAVTLHLLDTHAAAQLHAAFARRKIILDAFHAADGAAGREIWALDEFHQLRNGNARLVDLRANAVDDFAEIMRRHVGGHADGDAGAAVHEQVRERGGEN